MLQRTATPTLRPQTAAFSISIGPVNAGAVAAVGCGTAAVCGDEDDDDCVQAAVSSNAAPINARDHPGADHGLRISGMSQAPFPPLGSYRKVTAGASKDSGQHPDLTGRIIRCLRQTGSARDHTWANFAWHPFPADGVNDRGERPW